MYIDKLWGEYFGDCDDSLVLLDYFNENDDTQYSVKQIFTNFNIYNEYSPIEADSFRESKDIKVLILECLHNKKIYLKDLYSNSEKDKYISINADKEDIELFINILNDFSVNGSKYDLADMCDDETINDIAEKTKYIANEMSKFTF